jgi:large subunit ribosomal protein L7Ae
VRLRVSTSIEKVEVPSELVEAAYEALRLSIEVDGVKKGTNETTKAVERGQAELVLIAEDVDPPEIVMHLPYLCREKQIPYMHVPHQRELGRAAGLDVSCASACIVDPGEGEKFVEDIVGHLEKLGIHEA